MFTPAEQQFIRVRSEPGVVARINSRYPLENTSDQEVMFPPLPVAIYGVLPSNAAPNWSSKLEFAWVNVFTPSVKLYETGASTASSGVAQGKPAGRGVANVIEPVTLHPGGAPTVKPYAEG